MRAFGPREAIHAYGHQTSGSHDATVHTPTARRATVHGVGAAGRGHSSREVVQGTGGHSSRQVVGVRWGPRPPPHPGPHQAGHAEVTPRSRRDGSVDGGSGVGDPPGTDLHPPAVRCIRSSSIPCTAAVGSIRSSSSSSSLTPLDRPTAPAVISQEPRSRRELTSEEPRSRRDLTSEEPRSRRDLTAHQPPRTNQLMSAAVPPLSGLRSLLLPPPRLDETQAGFGSDRYLLLSQSAPSIDEARYLLLSQQSAPSIEACARDSHSTCV